MPSGYEVPEEQRIEIIREFIESGMSYREAVKHFNVSKSSLERWKKKYSHLAQKLENHEIRGTSTLYDAEGNAKLTWVKTSKEVDDAKERLKGFAEGLKDDLPQVKAVKFEPPTNEDLLTCYILTDLHIGMRSDEWNLEIAETNIRNYIHEAIETAPNSALGVLCFQGDTGHFDSLEPVTPASKHVVDADCNSRSMIRVIIKMIRYCVQELLKKHQHIHILFIEGNHDQYGSQHHSEWLNVHYEYEPRVTVDTNNNIYHVVEWGDTSLFFHHGHKRNLSEISKTFAGMFRDTFGRTKYSYGHIGHYHHAKRKPMGDDGLMDIRIHPTLSGKDDYALRGGYLSERAANVITYSKSTGYKGEFCVRPI